jgi:hypothetical protein
MESKYSQAASRESLGPGIARTGTMVYEDQHQDTKLNTTLTSASLSSINSVPTGRWSVPANEHALPC